MPAERRVAIALGLVFLSVLFSPASRDLFVGDETKYGQVVREMRTTGAFFLPTLNGTPFTHKPPLHFWLIDLFTYPLGLYSTWAFVLPSILAFGFLLWIMWRIGGPLAAYVCGTSLMIWGSAQTARMDVAFTALIALGLWQMQRGNLMRCAIALGIATLVKGPMAIVIGLVLFSLEMWRRPTVGQASACPDRLKPVLQRALAALLVMVAIPLLWFVPALMMGGSNYANDVMMKQTVGRAVASWVHKAPPWYYLERLPLSLFPWFFLAVAAVIALWRTHRFLVNWILAVLVPYSLMSSKLDVYMMTMIPAVALLVADAVRAGARWTRAANLISIALVFIGAVAGGAMMPREFDSVPGVNGFIVFTLIVSVVGFIIAARASLVTSTLMAGAVPVAVLLFVSINLLPFVNGFGSTRALVDVLQKQPVEPEEIALYSSPYLWVRDLPPRLERVRYVDAAAAARTQPRVIVTSRKNAKDIAATLAGYRKVDEVRMIGKWFDVYRR